MAHLSKISSRPWYRTAPPCRHNECFCRQIQSLICDNCPVAPPHHPVRLCAARHALCRPARCEGLAHARADAAARYRSRGKRSAGRSSPRREWLPVHPRARRAGIRPERRLQNSERHLIRESKIGRASCMEKGEEYEGGVAAKTNKGE